MAEVRPMADVRPIDANAFSAALKAQSDEYLSEGNLSLAAVSGICAGLLNSEELAPTLDYAPVRHGKWELWEDDYQAESWLQCSECGRKVMLGYDDRVTDEDVPRLTEQYAYCHCGAKMDGGEHDDRP